MQIFVCLLTYLLGVAPVHAALAVTKLQPKIISQDLGQGSDVSLAQINAFLTRYLVLLERDFNKLPQIVTGKGMVKNLSKIGDIIYTGPLPQYRIGSLLQVVVERSILDNKELSDKCRYLVVEEVALVVVKSNSKEGASCELVSAKVPVAPSMRLMPKESFMLPANLASSNYQGTSLGKILYLSDESKQGGQGQTAVLSIGTLHGVKSGSRLTIWRTIETSAGIKREAVGQILVYNSLDSISQGLITSIQGPIELLDEVGAA